MDVDTGLSYPSSACLFLFWFPSFLLEALSALNSKSTCTAVAKGTLQEVRIGSSDGNTLCKDYFEQKAMEKEEVKAALSVCPFLVCLRAGDEFPFEEGTFFPSGREKHLLSKGVVGTQVSRYKQILLNTALDSY